MITVNEALNKYCATRSLPSPTIKDCKNVGRLAVTHFKKFWGPNQASDVLSKFGVTLYGKSIVFVYPEEFKDELDKRIEYFYKLKAERKESVLKPKNNNPQPKRKRIPVKQRPTFVPRTRPK